MLSSSSRNGEPHSPEHVARLVDVGVSLGKIMDADTVSIGLHVLVKLTAKCAACESHVPAIQYYQAPSGICIVLKRSAQTIVGASLFIVMLCTVFRLASVVGTVTNCND